LKQFSAERIRNPKIRNLMKRVEFIRRPPRRGADDAGIDTNVEIAMKDRAVHRGHAEIARGHPALPPSCAEIAEKFRHCASGVLPPKQTERFLQKFDNLERADSIATWLQALCPARR
jgi:2-methylcitrate dehydratase PrpD